MSVRTALVVFQGLFCARSLGSFSGDSVRHIDYHDLTHSTFGPTRCWEVRSHGSGVCRRPV